MDKRVDKKSIDEKMIKYFLNELKTQCEYVFMSMNIVKIYKKPSIVFYGLHNTFTSLGNISKILFPQKAYESRGSKLRNILNIDDKSQFHFDSKKDIARKYRNILEHYDEKFEKWFNESYDGLIIDNNVGPKNMICIEGMKVSFLRHYDDSKNTFSFLDDEYDLNSVLIETNQIYKRIKEIENLGN